jgi:hypothetical protein
MIPVSQELSLYILFRINSSFKGLIYKMFHIFYRVLMIVYNTQDYWVFGLCPLSGILQNKTFQKLDLFLYSGEGVEDINQLGPLE